MSSQYFKLTEHTIPCAHIRQYPKATLHSQEDVLHLAVKQYTPLSNLNPKPGDLTIIGAHANGFPKELYEPLWDEIFQRLSSLSFRIRNIWIADVAHQGLSSVLNEDKLANDPSWLDHSRDLLNLINSFRAEMPRPIVGMGHSMGGAQITFLSFMHPRLFESIILIDPVIQDFTYEVPNSRIIPANLSAIRRDVWPNRKVAEASFKKSKFYQTWDPRVLDNWVKYGLRDLPTKAYPEANGQTLPYDASAKEVTLTTTKAQEVFSFLRPSKLETYGGNEEALTADERSELYSKTHNDMVPIWREKASFYRFEPTFIFSLLPNVRPAVLYVFGEDSLVCPAASREAKMEKTGIGLGGSGGAEKGMVKQVIVPEAGHLLAMERVGDVADAAAHFIGNTLAQWRRLDELERKYWDGVSEMDQITISKKRMLVFRDELEKLQRGKSKI